MFDVINFGTATLDVFLRSKGLELEKSDGAKEICVRYGAKIPVDELEFETGGGGGNAAVTFARQGLKVALLAKIADDFPGKKVKEDLEREGVQTQFLVIEKGGTTDYGTILWAPDGGRTILIYRGKTRLEVTEVPWKRLSTNWFYVTSIEGRIEVVEGISGLPGKIAWNPGGEELRQKARVLAALPKIEVFDLNKEEMLELLGGSESWSSEKLLRKASQLPSHYTVITDDLRGAFLHQKGKSFWWRSGIFKDSPRVEATGAGDAFGSGLVAGLIKGFSLPDCLKLATANAASVVSFVGAKKGILRSEEVGSWLKREILIERVNL
jgi:ribokinase